MQKKITKNELIFYFCYISFFIALFFEDMAFSNNFITPIIKSLKIIVILTLCFNTLNKKWGKKYLISFFGGLIVGGIILIFTGDFFFMLIVLLGFNSVSIDDIKIFKTSFYCCIFMSLITLTLFFVGILPDIISYRTDFSIEIRHSFGFNHNSILPLIFCYIFIYYVAIYQNKIRTIHIIIFLSIGIFLYMVCKSRNALISLIALSVICFLLNNNFLRNKFHKIITFLSQWSLLICIIFSIIPGFLRYKKIYMPLWYRFDSIFTNRSLLSASAIQNYGIKLINNMSYSEYSGLTVSVDSYIHRGLVLDSGYLYILIRYGILILIFTYLILISFYKKNKNNIYMCVVFLIMIILNLTDNDIMSYSCLPIMLIGVKNIWSEKVRWN